MIGAYNTETFKRFWKLITRIKKRNRVTERASSLAYFMILSLIPLSGVMVFVGALLLQTPHLFEATSYYVNSFFGENIPNIIQQYFIMREADGVPVGIVTGVGIFVFFYGASNVFYELRGAFFDIFNFENDGTKETITYSLNQRLLALAYMALLFSFVVLLISIYVSISVIFQATKDAIGVPEGISSHLAQSPVGFIISAILFTAVYHFVSFGRLTWMQALHGGVFASILLVVINIGLSIFLSMVASIDVYGVAGSLLGFFLWSNYVMFTILMGAIVAKASSVFKN